MALIYETETPRLYLQRMIVEEHVEDFWELWNSPEALIWSPQSPKTTLEEAREFFLTTVPNEGNPDIDKFAILLKPIKENPQPWTNSKNKPKMIGLVGTNRWSPQGMETGYCINIRHWSWGYASEAFHAFLELYWSLPERKSIKGLVAKVDPGNVASQKIVRKAGARRGEMLKAWYQRNIDGNLGIRRDLECWYLDREGFEADNKGKWEKRMKEGHERDDRDIKDLIVAMLNRSHGVEEGEEIEESVKEVNEVRQVENRP